MTPIDSPTHPPRRRRRILHGLAPLLLAGPLLAAPGPTPAESPDAALDAAVATQMRAAGIKGLGAAIIVRGEVVWQRGYGHADADGTRAFTPDTVMNVASITKPVVGVAMMRAVRAGKLDLDADINRYLPFRVVNPHHPTRPITLRHLATMTSGITDRREVYATTYRYGGAAREPLEKFLADYFTPGGRHYAPENFLDAPPGARREYSNFGTALAGLIVERATGETLPVSTRAHVFAPLGMTRTGWFPEELDAADQSTQFVAQNGATIPIQPYTSTTYPDGGLRTSVRDLTRLFLALLNGGEHAGARILDPASAAEMVRFQFTDGNRPENYPAAEGNSGLFWRTKFRGTRVGFGGNDPGVQAEMLATLSGDIGVIVLSNTSLSGPDQRAFGEILQAVWTRAERMR